MYRSPPGTERGSSQPDLSRLNIAEEDIPSQITLRKRKQPEQEDLKLNFDNFRKEIMSTLNEFVETQKKIMWQISGDVSSIKEDIKILHAATKDLNAEQIKMKSDIADLKLSNTNINTKVSVIEKDLVNIKRPLEFNSSFTCEEAVAEFQERQSRSKNIIIVGILEAKTLNKDDGIKSDTQEVTKILKSFYPECPEPNMIRRLGNYKPESNRPLKVFFPSPDTAITILRNKNKTTSNSYKIFSDQTPYQRKYLKNLHEELQLRTQNGEKDLIIKYINGTPKIIKKTSKN